MGRKICEYALYKGDTFIDIGTAEYLSSKYNIDKNYIYYRCYCKKQLDGSRNGIFVVKLD